MSRDTTLSPLAPLVQMIPRRGQGVAGKVPGSPGHLVEGSLQVVELLSLGLCSLPIEPLPVSLVGFQAGDQLGIDAPCYVFRSDSTPLPH